MWHFPSRYEDFSEIYKIADLEPGQQATISGLVREVNLRRSFRRRMVIVEAKIEDESGQIRAVWFNQPYLKNILRPGRMMNFSGKVSFSEGEVYLSHPDYEANYKMVGSSSSRISQDETWGGKHTGRLVPIYPETKGLTSRALRFILQPILRDIEEVEDFLPAEVLKKEELPEINQAIQKIHFPEDVEEVEKIKRRFAFQDLFLLQIFNIQQKLKLSREKAPEIETDIAYVKKVLETLPFKLTDSQKKSLWEVIKDLEKGQPMNRLLQGDVGSGKTVVAALAALITAKNGFQAAFMAPTEVLALQHFKTLRKLFLGMVEKNPEEKMPKIGIMTSSGVKLFFTEENLEAEIKKTEMHKKIKSGEAEIVIGTHALIQKNVSFKNLGLVIIDEQHRFGVRQRAHLVDQVKSSLSSHLLSMSATPIPRTLMLTIFGDLDISIIDEMPAGRKEIITKVVSSENRIKAYDFIRKAVAAGRQVFVICPRIDKSEVSEDTKKSEMWKKFMALDVKSVKEEYDKLSKKVFPGFKVGMLHGQMKSKEKEKIMNDFRDGKIQILVSTSVIEVGVDVPNATIMMIEGSERFGLAQLYQFRGRVGRGEHQSFCFLFSGTDTETSKNRLEQLVKAKSGFELAEKDLKLRGPGEFLGQSQTGMPDIAMEALQNPELIKSTREMAFQVLQSDPAFKKSPKLKEAFEEFQKKIHQE